MKNTIHLLKINAVKDYKIYCVFSNGEYRVIDIEKYLARKDLKPDSILSNLLDKDKVKNVIIENATLTWPNIKHVTCLSNVMAFEVALDLDPIVLYENSEIDEERDSAYQLGRELK
jgi:hypothetical protein